MKTAYIGTYDRLSTGERIRQQRGRLGLTQEELAERIGRTPKYYADIERGSCGMSVETLMALSEVLNLSLDFLIFGEETEEEKQKRENEMFVALDMLDQCSERKRKYALRMLELFLAACND